MSNRRELIIRKEGERKKESISPSFEMYQSVYLGNTDGKFFVDYGNNVKVSGFWNKLTCIIAGLICYYEDNVEFCNFDILYEKFLKSCHYLWVKEWLLDNYCLHLDLNRFRESGMVLQFTVFEDLNLAFLYPDEFKERLEEIVTSTDITLEYICENDNRGCLYD